MLKAHRAIGCLTSIASAMFGLAALIPCRLALGRIDSDKIENENKNNDASVEGMGIETVKILNWRKHWEDLSFAVLNFLRKQTKIIYIIGL